MTKIFAWIIGSTLGARLLRMGILLPIVYGVTDFLVGKILELASGVVLPSEFFPFLRYFYLDKCNSLFLSFLQVKLYLKFLDVYLKVV